MQINLPDEVWCQVTHWLGLFNSRSTLGSTCKRLRHLVEHHKMIEGVLPKGLDLKSVSEYWTDKGYYNNHLRLLKNPFETEKETPVLEMRSPVEDTYLHIDINTKSERLFAACRDGQVQLAFRDNKSEEFAREVNYWLGEKCWSLTYYHPKEFLIAGVDDSTVVIDVATGKHKQRIPDIDTVFVTEINNKNDTLQLVSGGWGGSIMLSVFSENDDQFITTATTSLHSDAVWRGGFLGSNNFATAGWDCTMSVTDLTVSQKIRSVELSGMAVDMCVLDQNTVISVDRQENLYLWDTRTQKPSKYSGYNNITRVNCLSYLLVYGSGGVVFSSDLRFINSHKSKSGDSISGSCSDILALQFPNTGSTHDFIHDRLVTASFDGKVWIS